MPQTNKMNGSYALRWKILERDNFTCQYCGQSAPSVKLEVDHILPFSEGGKTDEDNLTTSCYSCNRGKNALKVMTKSQRHTNIPEKSKTQEVLNIIKTHPSISTHAIAAKASINPNILSVYLYRLKHRGEITNPIKGFWQSKN